MPTNHEEICTNLLLKAEECFCSLTQYLGIATLTAPQEILLQRLPTSFSKKIKSVMPN